jgi:hypothetical protein
MPKPQDIIFFTILISILLIKKGKYAWHAGMLSFLGAGLLFMIGNLFTAQRLTWYGAGFITIEVIRQIVILYRKT